DAWTGSSISGARRTGTTPSVPSSCSGLPGRAGGAAASLSAYELRRFPLRQLPLDQQLGARRLDAGLVEQLPRLVGVHQPAAQPEDHGVLAELLILGGRAIGLGLALGLLALVAPLHLARRDRLGLRRRDADRQQVTQQPGVVDRAGAECGDRLVA